MLFRSNKPSAVICHTVKGKGFKTTEHNADWHHKAKVKPEELAALLAELEASA